MYKVVIVKGIHLVEAAINEAAAERWSVVPGSISSIGANLCVLMEKAVDSFSPPVKEEFVFDVETETEKLREELKDELRDKVGAEIREEIESDIRTEMMDLKNSA